MESYLSENRAGPNGVTTKGRKVATTHSVHFIRIRLQVGLGNPMEHSITNAHGSKSITIRSSNCYDEVSGISN